MVWLLNDGQGRTKERSSNDDYFPERVAEEAMGPELLDGLIQSSVSQANWPEVVREGYRAKRRARMYAEHRFLLIVGLCVAYSTCLVDYLAGPEIFKLGLILRTALLLPATLIGLAAGFLRKDTLTCVMIGLCPIIFGGISEYLALMQNAQQSAKYFAATGLLLGMCNLALTYNLRNLIYFNLAFLGASFAIILAFAPNPLFEYASFFLLLAIISAGTLPMAARFERLRSASFLSDLKAKWITDDLIEANRKLQRLSDRDPLTGIANRRFFERVYDEMSAARLSGDSEVPDGAFGVFMIDLDHFKPFNDRHGHQAGDTCLKQVADALRHCFKGEHSMVARFGGEEFVAGVLETEPGQLLRLAEKARATIEGLGSDSDGSPMITASVGLATMPNGFPVPLSQIFEMADAALYAAKRGGRNKVEIIDNCQDQDRPVPHQAMGRVEPAAAAE